MLSKGQGVKAKRKKISRHPGKPLGKSLPGVVVYRATPDERPEWMTAEDKRAAQHLAAILRER